MLASSIVAATGRHRMLKISGAIRPARQSRYRAAPFPISAALSAVRAVFRRRPSRCVRRVSSAGRPVGVPAETGGWIADAQPSSALDERRVLERVDNVVGRGLLHGQVAERLDGETLGLAALARRAVLDGDLSDEEVEPVVGASTTATCTACWPTRRLDAPRPQGRPAGVIRLEWSSGASRRSGRHADHPGDRAAVEVELLIA